MMDESSKVRENRLRRVAERRGLRLEKSRRRDAEARDYNGFMLIDSYSLEPLIGHKPYMYSASLNDIVSYFSESNSTYPYIRNAKIALSNIESIIMLLDSNEFQPSNMSKSAAKEKLQNASNDIYEIMNDFGLDEY